MKLILYSIFDSAVKVYQKPFFAQYHGHVVRELYDILTDPAKTSSFAKHPADFTLFSLGVFDDETGKITLSDAPERIVCLLEIAPSDSVKLPPSDSVTKCR